MEYTEQQKAEFKEQFATRRTRQIVCVVVILAVILPLMMAEERADQGLLGMSVAVLGPLVLGVVVAGVIFSFRNWRCPACNRYLGKGANPVFCPRCGVELQ